MKKTMQKIILLVGMLLMFSSILTGSALAADPLGSYLRITLINQDPDPVEPGGWVELRFKIENQGRQGTDEVTLELLPKFPFKLPPGESATRNVGSFQAQQIGEDAIIIKYRLLVDENAPEGENPIELRYKEGVSTVLLEEFFVDIRAFDAFLSIDNIDVDPEMIAPGETGDVRITLKNDAESTLKIIKAKIDLTDIPLAPTGSTNEKVVDLIAPGETNTVRFTLTALPNAESMLYKVPLYLNFKDELGRNFTMENIIGITIGDAPDLSVLVESSEIYKKKQSGTINLKLVNKGVSDIKLLNIYVQDSDDYDIISPAEIYVGNIDTDDYENADVSLYLKSGSDAFILPLRVEYMSANNEKFVKEYSLSVPLYSDSKAKKIGITPGNGSTGIILFVIVLIAGGIFYWRWRKKKKKKHA